MKTIVEPKEYVDKLWGKQRIRSDATYRMMRYVLRQDCNDGVLLHNTITGQLVILDHEEAKVLEALPKQYDSVMKQLVEEHYLVPDTYDEHDQVVKLRLILWKMDDLNGPKDVTNYTILPTTGCNARCYYCFEQGARVVTMSEKTADDAVEYISAHCGSKRKVFITWFGGEPTIAANRIERISSGLREKGIDFRSKMITNGFLFDEDMVTKAKLSWNVEKVQICVDGVEDSYNKIKAYVATTDNPYQRVMRNIGLLLNNGIGVGLRMNFDVGNYHEFKMLLDEAKARFGDNELLVIGIHAVVGEYPNHDGIIEHGSDDWFAEKLVELGEMAREYGYYRIEKPLPSLNYEVCGACRDSMTVITPGGYLARCPEKFEEDQFTGHVTTGITNPGLVRSWKKVADYPMCIECPMFPCCVRLVNCSNTTYCHKRTDAIKRHKDRMSSIYAQTQSMY